MGPNTTPIVEGYFRVDEDRVDEHRADEDRAVLLGGRSISTGLTHFPRRPVCPWTGADDVEPVDLPTTGRLREYTVVTAAPPGYRAGVPYALGVVELDDGLRVIGRILGAGRNTPAADALAPGTQMRVVTDTVEDSEGNPGTIWAFAVALP